MTLKRVHVNGYIELADAAELPLEGSILTLGKVRLEVTGNHRDKQQRRGEAVEWVYTAPTKLLEGATISRVDEPAGEPTLPLDAPIEGMPAPTPADI